MIILLKVTIPTSHSNNLVILINTAVSIETEHFPVSYAALGSHRH